MTKELEALEKIESTTISSRVGDWGMEYTQVKDLTSTKSYFDTLRTALTELEQLRHVPTADEVCEAITSFLKERDVAMLSKVHFNDNSFWFYDDEDYRTEVCRYDEMENSLTFWYRNNLSLHLINLISRFYMGVDSK